MRHLALILLLFLAADANGGAGAPPADDKSGLHGEVARLLAELNSDRFEVRHKAAEELEKLVAKPELGRELAGEFQRTLVQTDISFEVRRQVERWSRRLPAPPADPVADASTQELDELVRRLDDDSYGVRLGAARRLEWLLGNPKLICPIMLRLKRRLSDDALDGEARRRLEALWQRARGEWLSHDAADQGLPAVSDRQIGRWLNELVRPGAGGAADAAECELLDLLARDDYLPRLKRAMEAKLSQKPNGNAAARLRSLLDWTKPEVVVEYWAGRQEKFEQHLLLGVPTRSEGAARPTCFDRADDRWAHCTSGNSLVPGDYRVGEAFPHPRQDGAFFHLVSLPTPRRRMAYTSAGNADEQKRLAAISRRTLDQVLADKRSLSEPELLMLEQLDPAELSRFAGRYFLLVDDRETARSGRQRLGGRPSRFGMICARLAIDGGKDAMPGLGEAIAKNRFLPPTLLAPYRLELLAALSIAGRDPWPGVDDWLADRVGESKLLVEGHTSGAELGATAAALLLKRHSRQPAGYDLLPLDEALMERLHVSGYRFGNKETCAKIQQWWREEKERKKS
ncbi:MAG: hypothetical protein WCB27_24415 [Thermoguttaceae bacterium]|jgi:hypothetical protein